MSEKIDTTIALLTQFGMSEPEAKIYLEILSERGDTALALSRILRIARTKVYRILDNLIARGLVVTRLGDRGARFVALPPDQLNLLLSDKERELNRLRQTIPTLQTQLATCIPKPREATKVLYYHGTEGLKQVTHNSLKAKGELLIYEIETMNSFLSRQEAEDFRRKFVANKIFTRTLTIKNIF